MSQAVSNPAAQSFDEWHLVFLSTLEWPLVWAAIGLALISIALALRATARQPINVRVLLVGLRVAAVGSLLLVVLQPALRLRNVTRFPNHVAVLVDLSRSMRIRDRPNDASRIDQAVGILERSEETFRRWRERRVVDFYGFHSELVAWPGSGRRVDADGMATRMQGALAQLRKRYRGSELAGVVLISDGIDNGRFGAALTGQGERFAVGMGAPLHTVRVGRDELRDLALGPVHADSFAFVRNAVKVEVELRATGVEAQKLPVTLQQDGVEVARRELTLSPSKSEYRLTFEFVPQRVGKYVYRVAAPLLPNEAVRSNNAESFMLHVIRDRVRVLQVCGRPSWDERFLRQLLKRDPNVDLISFFILRTPASLALVPPSELSLIPFPTEELFERELGSFDLVILQDFNYGPYGIGAYLPLLGRYVEEGGALVMLGGDLSFTSGGYHGTPVGDLLPVRLLPPSPLPEQLLDGDVFRPSLTSEGWEHPMLQLGRDRSETERLLAKLPPLVGVNLVGPARKGAVVLASHPRLRASDGHAMPVLAVREVGKGRVMAFASDSLWRWAFTAVATVGSRHAYDRFWRGAIRWLIRDPDLEYLRIVPRADRIAVGETAQLTIRAYLPGYRPASAQRLSYAVDLPGGGKGPTGDLVSDELGEAHLSFPAERGGAYRVRAWATIGERRTDAAELLLVERRGVEEQQPKARSKLLEQLAQSSGGRFLERVEELPDLPFLSARVQRVNWSRDVEVWNTGWFLFAALLVLSLDWAIRRRYGHF